jgi:hypothetical protein
VIIDNITANTKMTIAPAIVMPKDIKARQTIFETLDMVVNIGAL